MTSMTSSGASDTDRARNCTSGWWGRTPPSTACPPPPGRCTSSRTTSGSRSLMSSMAAAASSASPTTSTALPSSARTPARKTAWSSTRKMRGLPLGAGAVIGYPSLDALAPRHGELDLGPLPRRRTDDRRAPEARHAGSDGLGDALPVLRYGIGVEAEAAVPYVEHDRVRLDLGVHGHLVLAGPLGSVHGGFAYRIEQRAQGL